MNENLLYGLSFTLVTVFIIYISIEYIFKKWKCNSPGNCSKILGGDYSSAKECKEKCPVTLNPTPKDESLKVEQNKDNIHNYKMDNISNNADYNYGYYPYYTNYSDYNYGYGYYPYYPNSLFYNYPYRNLYGSEYTRSYQDIGPRSIHKNIYNKNRYQGTGSKPVNIYT